MSFGSKKSNRGANAGSDPFDFWSPYGNVITDGGNVKFQPKLNEAQRRTSALTDDLLLSTLSGINPNLSVNDVFNNPFVHNIRGLNRSQLSRERSRASKRLDDDLNARNLLGGSFDAMRRRDQDELFANLERSGETQARMQGLDIFNNQLQNQLGLLTGLRSDRNAALQGQFLPLSAFSGMLPSLTGLQTAQASPLSGGRGSSGIGGLLSGGLGTALGAGLGSIVPGIGTAIGAKVGGLLGGGGTQLLSGGLGSYGNIA